MFHPQKKIQCGCYFGMTLYNIRKKRKKIAKDIHFILTLQLKATLYFIYKGAKTIYQQFEITIFSSICLKPSKIQVDTSLYQWSI